MCVCVCVCVCVVQALAEQQRTQQLAQQQQQQAGAPQAAAQVQVQVQAPSVALAPGVVQAPTVAGVAAVPNTAVLVSRRTRHPGSDCAAGFHFCLVRGNEDGVSHVFLVFFRRGRSRTLLSARPSKGVGLSFHVLK